MPDERWDAMMKTLRLEQATGVPEQNRHVGGLDTDRRRSMRRHVLETEVIHYDAEHTWERR